jgi:hypothetical protein
VSGRRLIAALALGAALAAPSALGAASSPAIRPLGTAPLTVRGTHFKARERVRVTVQAAGRSSVRRILVRADGTFTLEFTGLAIDRCLGYSLSAAGSSGDRAAWAQKLPPPACPPA